MSPRSISDESWDEEESNLDSDEYNESDSNETSEDLSDEEIPKGVAPIH
jgi:hypothetical protein